MSGSEITIDARGLACPQPVVLAKKAIEESPAAIVAVIVDSETARENVLRFAAYSGRAARSGPGRDGATIVEISAADAAEADAADVGAAAAGPAAGTAARPAPGVQPIAPPASPGPRGPATVLLAADRLGQGDDDLGRLLMKGFIYALSEGEKLPRRIILMNSGARLAAEGSASLESLRRLEARGVEILACGTCLDFFALKDALGVGRVSNMYEIVALLIEGAVLRP